MPFTKKSLNALLTMRCSVLCFQEQMNEVIDAMFERVVSRTLFLYLPLVHVHCITMEGGYDCDASTHWIMSDGTRSNIAFEVFHTS